MSIRMPRLKSWPKDTGVVLTVPTVVEKAAAMLGSASKYFGGRVNCDRDCEYESGCTVADQVHWKANGPLTWHSRYNLAGCPMLASGAVARHEMWNMHVNDSPFQPPWSVSGNGGAFHVHFNGRETLVNLDHKVWYTSDYGSCLRRLAARITCLGQEHGSARLVLIDPRLLNSTDGRSRFNLLHRGNVEQMLFETAVDMGHPEDTGSLNVVVDEPVHCSQISISKRQPLRGRVKIRVQTLDESFSGLHIRLDDIPESGHSVLICNDTAIVDGVETKLRKVSADFGILYFLRVGTRAKQKVSA